VSKHIKTIFEDGELLEKVVVNYQLTTTQYIFKRTEEAFIQQIKKMLVRLNDEIKNLSTN
jgi:hypothetical protein